MSNNDQILQQEILRSGGTPVILGTTPPATEPPSPALPAYYRQIAPTGTRPLIKLGYAPSNDGLKEFINFSPLNIGAGVFTEQALTALGATLTVPSSSNLVQMIQVNPFTGKAATSLVIATSTGIATITNNDSAIIDNLPFNTYKEDNPSLAVYGGSTGTFAPLKFVYSFDSTRYIYKLLLNLPLVIYVPTYTSGNYNFGTFTMTMTYTPPGGTPVNIIPPVSFNLGALFNVINATTLTGITNGISIAVLRGELVGNQILQQKIPNGTPITISISWTKTSGGGTSYSGIVEDSFPDTLANTTKKFYPVGMQIHSYATPDHIDTILTDPLYQNRFSADGVQIGT